MSSAGDNSAQSTPVLAIALAGIAFLGVATAFMPASWFGVEEGDKEAKSLTSSVATAPLDEDKNAAAAEKTEDATKAEKQSVAEAQATSDKPVPAVAKTSQPVDVKPTSEEQVASKMAESNAAKATVTEKKVATAKPANVVQQPIAPIPYGMPQPAMQWRPPHLSAQRDGDGFSMQISPPVRPRFPQPPQYPGYVYPNPYNSGNVTYPAMPMPPQPYFPGAAGQ